ncbi:MAG: hypothetical protein ACXWA9_14820 [Acidimicrobiia bacterium]
MTKTEVERIPVRRILHDVGESYRHRFGRVVIAAALVFGATAVIGAAVEDVLHQSHDNFVVYVFALAGTAMSQVGVTFYAGLLDKVVGEFELGEPPEPIMQVLRTLPYGSLIVADIAITVATATGALFLVIPGLIVFTLFAITGPVINIEHLGAFAGMRRSAHLVRPHFWLVFFLVAIPLGVEHEIINWSGDVTHHHALVEVFLVQGITGMIVGSFVGLVEVNVAYALELGEKDATPTPT